jgi:hypothetical protein
MLCWHTPNATNEEEQAESALLQIHRRWGPVTAE